MKRKIILHCGAPKTGSTSLQYYFRDNAEALKAAGIVFPARFHFEGDVDPLHDAFAVLRRPNVSDRKAGRAAAIIRRRLDEMFAEAGVDTILISNESLLGQPVVPEERTFFPWLARATPQMKAIFADYDVEAVLFVRDLAGYLPSYYVQHVRRGLTWGWDRYVASLDPATISWLPLIEHLEAAFGPDHVRVYDHADLIRKGPETVADAFGRFAPDLPAFDPDAYWRNSSLGPSALVFYRGVNWVFNRLVPRKKQKKARLGLRKYFLAPVGDLFPDGKLKMPEPLRETLAARFKAESPRWRRV